MYPTKIWLYEKAYECRHFALLVFCLLSLAIAALAGGAVYVFMDLRWITASITMSTVAILLVVVLSFWTTVFAWYSVTFRYMAYAVSRFWARTGWHMLAILTLAAALFVCIAGFAVDDNDMQRWAVAVLLALFVLLVVRWLFRSRKRVVVNAFTNYAGKGELDESVAGVATRLVNQFLQLSKLYSDINRLVSDERSESGQRVSSITFGLEDEGGALQDAVSAESKITLFKVIEFPVGAIFGSIQRFVRGPRLTGSIHRDGGQITLTANLRHGRKGFAWQVSTDDLPKRGDTDHRGGMPESLVVAELVEQLGMRIWTDLVPGVSNSWRAVEQFTKGLRQCREATADPVRRVRALDAAERAFNEALVHDQAFPDCRHNLAVVSEKLLSKRISNSNGDRVKVELETAVRLDPRNLVARRTLALQHWSDEQFDQVIFHCRCAISLSPETAWAWDLREVATVRNTDQTDMNKDQKAAVWQLSCGNRATATALAWRTLCRDIRKGADYLRTTDDATRVTLNLAVAMAEEKSRPSQISSLKIFAQAVWLEPENATNRLELAKVQYNIAQPEQVNLASVMQKNGQPAQSEDTPPSPNLNQLCWYKKAAQTLKVTDVRLLASGDRATYWAILANSYNELKKNTDAEKAREQFITVIALNQDKMKYIEQKVVLYTKYVAYDFVLFQKLISVMQKLDVKKLLHGSPDDSSGREPNWIELFQNLHKRSYEVVRAIRVRDHLHDKLFPAEPSKAESSLTEVDLEEVIKLAEKLNELVKDDPFLRRESGIHGYAAYAYLERHRQLLEENDRLPSKTSQQDSKKADYQKNLLDALRHAERGLAVADDWSKDLLGDIYFQIEDFERAAELWHQSAIRFDGEKEARHAIGILTNMAYAFRGQAGGKRGARSLALERAVQNFESGLVISRAYNFDISLRAELHIIQGRTYLDLNQYERAIPHLRAALNWDYKSMETQGQLAFAYLRSFDFDAVRSVYESVKSDEPADKDERKSWILIHLCYAMSLIERQVSFESDQVTETTQTIDDFCNINNLPDKSDKPLQGMAHECRGWRHYRRGKTKDAIRELQEAAQFSFDAEIYYRLARAYLRHAHETSAQDRQRAIEHARDACKLCSRADLANRYSEELDEIRRDLDLLVVRQKTTKSGDTKEDCVDGGKPNSSSKPGTDYTLVTQNDNTAQVKMANKNVLT